MGLDGFNVQWFDRFKTIYSDKNWFDQFFVPLIVRPIAAAIHEYDMASINSFVVVHDYQKTCEAQWLLKKWHEHCKNKELFLSFIDSELGIDRLRFAQMIAKNGPTLYEYQSVFCMSEDITLTVQGNCMGHIPMLNTLIDTLKERIAVRNQDNIPPNIFCYSS